MMKYVLVMFVLISTVWTARAQAPLAMATPKVAVQWETTAHDFGTIHQRVPHSAKFSFTNRLSEPVLIMKAVGSCGCTVADYTKEVIAPGGQGVVRATYNAAQLGAFAKTVSVTLSTGDKAQVLRIQGTVVE